MIEKIRNGSRRLYRCKTCGTMFNELGETYEHSCGFNIKINNRKQKYQGEPNGFRGTLEKPIKRSYNLQGITERDYGGNGCQGFKKIS